MKKDRYAWMRGKGNPAKRLEVRKKLIAGNYKRWSDPEYKKKLHNYEHALYKRNKILEHHADAISLPEELSFWNDYLGKQAIYITKKREEYISYLNDNQKVEDKNFRIKYIKNELTRERLESVFAEEKRLRKTIIGPQKDDFHTFLSNGEEKNIHHFVAYVS